MHLTPLVNGFNRRENHRVRAHISVALVAGGRKKRSRTLNLSCTGARLWVDSALPDNERVQLTLDLPNRCQVEARGRTVWQQSLGAMGSHIVGVRFEGPVGAIEQWLHSA